MDGRKEWRAGAEKREETGRLTRQMTKKAITSAAVVGIAPVAAMTTAVARFSMMQKTKAKTKAIRKMG